MQELKANMAVLGKEAAAALASVESQQQRLTFQRLVAMVCLRVFLRSSFLVESFNGSRFSYSKNSHSF